MNEESLAERRRALEDSFFRKQHAAVLSELRARRGGRADRAEASRASGLSDQVLLDLVLDLGMATETLAALSLVPLVEVAWADGRMEGSERSAILSAAAAQGLERGTPGFDLLRSWLEERPDAGLLESWTVYVRGLATRLAPEDRARLRGGLLRRARIVAQAAGGFLRLGSKISEDEEAMLQRLEQAFGEVP
jgi:hypothetical protein